MYAQISLFVIPTLVLLICHVTVEEMVEEKEKNLSADFALGVTCQFVAAAVLSLGIWFSLVVLHVPALWAFLGTYGGLFILCWLDYFVLCALAGIREVWESAICG